MQGLPKKFLGQHFLIDRNVQKKIIYSVNLEPEDFVLEIGAGRGELTQLIAKTGAKVFALEIDQSLYKELKKNFKDYKNVKIIRKNILDFNIKKYFQDITSKKIKVIGNIPYYITTPIILHLIKYRQNIKEVFLTVQKEFARRITSLKGSKDYGAITCFVQYYTEPKILFLIKRNSFYPVPKVDSCFVRLRFRDSYPLDNLKEKMLFRIIRTAFTQRRKTLKNSLKRIIPAETLQDFFRYYNLSFKVRAEDLSLDNFINLLRWLD